MRIEDNFYKYLNLYKSAPEPVKRIFGILYKKLPYSVKYSKYYIYWKNLLESSKNWTEEEIRRFQICKINELIKIAKENCPYYRSSLKGISFPIRSLEYFSDKVPFITKSDVRNSTNELINIKYKKKDLIAISTSGTTGEPLKLYYEKGMARTKELVYMNNQWRRIGYNPGDLCAVFRSALIRNRVNDKLWEYDAIKNRYFFSTFDLTEENIKKYIKKLREIRPKFLHVYPSALTIIASFMKKDNIKPINSIRGILSGSENTYPHQIKLFEDVFKCKVFRWYGLCEMSALAGSCEFSYNYHCYPTYSYVELIDEKGSIINEEDKVGEIVGTTFDNYVMPLIRYRTGDFAIYGGEKCSYCGRYNLIFKEIEGRAQEYIIDKNGNKYSLGPFIFGIHDEFWSDISSIQFKQEEKGKLILYGTSNSLSPSGIKSYLYSIWYPRLSGNFELEVIPLNYIKRGSIGKHKFLVQNLKIN